MSALAWNFAKQFSDDVLSKFKGFTYAKVFHGNEKGKNEALTIKKYV